MAPAWLHGVLRHLQGGVRTTLPYALGHRYGGDLRAALRETQPFAYVEMRGGFALLVALNWRFFREDNWGYFDVNPHPFWLVVVPIAVRYDGSKPAAGRISPVGRRMSSVWQTGQAPRAGLWGTRPLKEALQ